MKNKILTYQVLLLFSLLICQPVYSQEFIGGVGAKYIYNKTWNIGVEFQSRYIQKEVNQNNLILQSEIGCNITKNLSLSASYRYTSAKTLNYSDVEDIEDFDKNRYAADIRYDFKRFDNGIKISHKIKYQYSEIGDSRTKEYLRYKLNMDYKLSENAKPYLAIEPYYRLDKNKFKCARFYLGNEFAFKNTKIDIFLITEGDLDSKTLNLYYILGAKLCWDIKR